MNDLLKKLNTLINAGIHDIAEEVQKAASTPAKYIPRNKLGPDIEGEVDKLRKKINDALDYEDEINQKIDGVQKEIDKLDRQADEALSRDDEGNARYYLERMHRAEQRKTMLEADLSEHRIATQELMQRVNELDATIAEARHREERAAQQPPEQQVPASSSETSIPVQVEPTESDKPVPSREEAINTAREVGKKAERVLSEVLREARETIDNMNDLVEAKTDVQEVEPSITEQVADEIAKEKIDDDIAARRSRLSAPPKKQDE